MCQLAIDIEVSRYSPGTRFPVICNPLYSGATWNCENWEIESCARGRGFDAVDLRLREVGPDIAVTQRLLSKTVSTSTPSLPYLFSEN